MLEILGKFELGVWNEAGQQLTEFCQENTLVIANTLFNSSSNDSTYGHHPMVNSEIRLSIFFVAKDKESLHSHQKQDQEMTMVPVMYSLLQNLDVN